MKQLNLLNRNQTFKGGEKVAIQGLYKIFDHWHQEGTLFIFSDPHFGDSDLETGIHNRPSAAEIVQRINAKCGRKDTLICLGDVGDVEYVKLLRAKRKILVCGNHDAGSTNYKREIVKRIFDRDIHPDKAEIRSIMEKEFPGWAIRIEEDYDFHCPFNRWIVYADNKLFDEVYEGPLMIAEKLILSHEPVDAPWAFNIHGHIHDPKHKNDKCHFNVCSDAIDYVPINMNQWMKQGYLSHVESIHRDCINKATIKAKKKKK